MSLPAILLPSVIEIGKQLIERLVPDKAKRAEAEIELQKLLIENRKEIIDATTASDAGQVSVNVEEAKSDNLFKSGWRPSVGWVCTAGLAYQFLLRPIGTWFSVAYGAGEFPALELGDLLTLLFGLLGLGTLRTIDKKNGVA